MILGLNLFHSSNEKVAQRVGKSRTEGMKKRDRVYEKVRKSRYLVFFHQVAQLYIMLQCRSYTNLARAKITLDGS